MFANKKFMQELIDLKILKWTDDKKKLKLNINATRMAKKILNIEEFEGDSFHEKLYLKLTGTTKQKCVTCNKNFTRFKSIFEGYSRFCSPSCSQKHTDVQEKYKNTMLQKYGVTSAFNLPESRRKIKEKIKNGVTGQKIKQKIMQAFKENGKEILNKRNKTNLEKYGNIVPANSVLNLQKRYKNIYEKTEQNIIKQNFSIISKTPSGKIDVVKHICGEEFSVGRISKDTHLRCPKCHIIKSSEQQREILNWIINSNIEAIESDRNIIKPYELDIFLPEKNIAIEFNGLYWHSDKSSIQNQFYHRNKLDLCKEKNIRLINIYEDDFRDKKDIIFSRLSILLNINITKIYARMCDIREVSNKDLRLFLIDNHLQGYIPTKINYGLYFNNELVSVMAFNKPRYNKKYQWELIRYCTKKYTSVIGGGKKLLNHFYKHNSGSLITYHDLSWGYTTMYNDLGFKLEYVTDPGYSYYQESSCKRISRIGFQKKNFENTTNKKWDDNLSENENANNAKCYKIWDCGQQVFVIEK
jgi:hypothetical protein